MKAVALVLAMLTTVTSFASTNCNVKEISFDTEWDKKFTIQEMISLLESKGYTIDLNSPTAKVITEKGSALRFLDTDFMNRYQDISFSFYSKGNLPGMQMQGSDFWLWDLEAKVRNRVNELKSSAAPVVAIENASDLQSEKCGPYSSVDTCETEGVEYSFVKAKLFKKTGKRVSHDKYYKDNSAMIESLTKLADAIPACSELDAGKKDSYRTKQHFITSKFGYQ